MAAAGSDRSAAVHAAPPASAPPRMPPRRPGSRRRCRRRLGCVAPVPRRPATRRVERFGPGGQETSAHRSASRPHKARAEVHGRFQRGSWLAPCPNPSLATRASPKSGSFTRPELCCLGGQQYYYPVRLPRHCPGLRLWPYTRASFRGYRPTHGCRRVSPVAWTTFAACCPPYAGAVPGCSRIQGPDCCLRPTHPGSARSVPHGLEFRRGRVQLPYGLQLCSTSLRLRLSTVTGDFTTGLLWRLARTGLSPAGRQPLLGGTRAPQARLPLLPRHHPQCSPPPRSPAPPCPLLLGGRQPLRAFRRLHRLAHRPLGRPAGPPTRVAPPGWPHLV